MLSELKNYRKILVFKMNNLSVKKKGSVKPYQFQCLWPQVITILLLLLFVVLLTLIILLAPFVPIQFKELQHVKIHHRHLHKEISYHNTLLSSLDKSSLNPKICQEEAIWKKSVRWRKYILSEDNKRGEMEMLNIFEYFPPSFKCPYIKEKIGYNIGSLSVCGLEHFVEEEECVFYSFGALHDDPKLLNENSLLDKTKHCHLYAYVINEVDKKIANDTLNCHLNRANVKFIEEKVSDWNLDNALKNNGHGWVDILKINLDNKLGLSMLNQAIVEQIDLSPIGVGVLPFGQLHIRFVLPHENQSIEDYVKLFTGLEDNGLRPFHAEVVKSQGNDVIFQYSFINLKGKHILLK